MDDVFRGNLNELREVITEIQQYCEHAAEIADQVESFARRDQRQNAADALTQLYTRLKNLTAACHEAAAGADELLESATRSLPH